MDSITDVTLGSSIDSSVIQNILTVCVGNICRSPMAEGLLRYRLHSGGRKDIEVTSAGLHALVGEPPDPLAQKIMDSRGIDISAHRAKQLSEELVFWADLVLVMEYDHKQNIEHRYPTTRGKVFLIGKWSNTEVPDPFGQEEAAFRLAYEKILKGANRWVWEIISGTS